MRNWRFKKVKESLNKISDAILISSIPNIIYLTGFNGFSNEEREAYMLITKKNSYVFTDGRYSEAIARLKDFKLIETSPSKNFEQALREIIDKEKIKKLAIDEHDVKASELIQIRKAAKICSDNNPTESLRSTKDTLEIENIQKACKLGDKIFKQILPIIKLGTTEKLIAKKIEILTLENDAEISFKPIVAFGENSSSPHHVSSDKKLKKNEIVLLDFGIKVNNYCSDMSRTVFFGKASDKQKLIYKTVLDSQSKAIEALSNHKTASGFMLDKIAREHILSQNFPTIPHSLGHGVGLEIHEKPRLSPKSKDTLSPGMIFSVEPGIYLPGFGGFRIEDLVLLTKNGPQIITHSSREIIEL